MKRQLILENGTTFIGEGFGSLQDVTGEVVFNTGMTGYQETISNPSACGQIVTMTYPLIGNYGINRDDFESINPAIHGLIVREVAEIPSNFRSKITLNKLMEMKGIPGLSGIDTRKLTRTIREHGELNGMICGMDVNVSEIVEKLKNTQPSTNKVEKVSTKRAYPSPGRGLRVVLVDFGMKHGILRELNKRDCDVIVVPHNTTADEIIAHQPDGLILSNGPGDPKDVPEAVEMIQGVIGKMPIFGICLGHQLFALACGADTFKMKFGHRGSNYPVKELATGKVEITGQNHGFSVDPETLNNTRLEITHTALNDGIVAGLRHLDSPAFSVQFHPEGSPGPEDANHLFDRFLSLMNDRIVKENENA